MLRISDTAAAGYTSALTNIVGGEEAFYGITVLAPPAPTLTAPADGLRTLETSPAISGTKRAGNSVIASVDGASVCTVAADASTTWSCTPSTPLAFGSRAIAATQASPAGDLSAASTVHTIEVLEPAALTVSQAGPASAVPTVAFERTVSIGNSGPGTATGVSASVELGGLPATTCTVAGTATDCALLSGGVGLGDLAPGTTVVISIVGRVPAGTAAGTTYTVSASASSINDASSPVVAAADVVVAAPSAPVITGPAAGSTTTNRSISISGTALAGAAVSVHDAAGTLVCSATTSSSGAWSCAPVQPFAVGTVAVRATQSLGGLTSPRSSTRTFQVVAPTVVSPPAVAPPTSSGPSRPAPAPATPRPTPAPVPPPAAKPDPTPPVPSTRPLALNIRFPGASVVPGTVSAMRGTIGPSTADEAVTITFSGTVDKGMIYRTVRVEPGGECAVLTTTFSCTITLLPGETADVKIRLYADALNAPERVRQQLVVNSSEREQANAATSTIEVAGGGEAATASFLTLDMASFPGAFLPLLALLLFALAATVTEQARRARVAAAPPIQTDSDDTSRPQENTE
ncbi:hypothetical protein [Microbacterium oxydans]|uniref:hypothetical protein n=1 Tax=Microbacterium oxydans TaxID=82380 RepID=UPI00226B443E|nr:hypothetical protein [Microbacterium oxydans]WAA65625.1 hypothetical protein MME74_15535 [Microbacterium oxydans]